MNKFQFKKIKQNKIIILSEDMILWKVNYFISYLDMCIGCRPHGFNLAIKHTKEDKDKRNAFVPSFLKKLKEHKHELFSALLGTTLSADTIFKGGKIYTMDEKNTVVQAVAVKGKKILAAGSWEKIQPFNSQGVTKIVDLNGKTMLPGFVEPHVHAAFAYFDSWVDLGPFVNSTFDDVKRTLTEAVSAAEKTGQSMMGQLFDPLITPGTIFDVSMKGLDSFSTTVPIFILESNGHVGHANSKAFEKAGVSKDTPDPPNGRFMRDENGNLTGEIQEVTALNYFIAISNPVSLDQYEANIEALFKMANTQGVTTFHDCGVGTIDAELDYLALSNVMKESPTIRFGGYLVSTHWDYWKNTMKLKPDNSNDYFRLNGIKSWSDGSTQGGSAYFRENYLKEEWGNGFANYTQKELTQTVTEAHNEGWQVGVHCNGDAGIDMALNAFESAQKNNKKLDMRHRIEHCTFCWDEQFERMSKVDVYPSFLIGHVYYYGKVFKEEIVGEKRADICDSIKTALKYDRKPTIHSDYNCQPIDPIRCIYNAVTRIMRDNGEILNPKERVDPIDAVRAITIDAAWQCQMDDIVGSIEKGKYADFVVLNKDPMQVPRTQIIDIKVSQTWFEGKVAFENPQHK